MLGRELKSCRQQIAPMSPRYRYLNHALKLSRIALRRWRRRTLFLIVCLLVGAAATGMALLADVMETQWHQFLLLQRYAALAVTPLGFGFALFLAQRFFPNSQGSGIPQVIAARALPNGERRLALVSLKVAAGKFW